MGKFLVVIGVEKFIVRREYIFEMVFNIDCIDINYVFIYDSNYCYIW